jgi:MSHA pilin protein MshD
MTAGSADPQVRKQVLAIAESLMDEVALKPFTYCDPDDPAAPTATSVGSCATPEVMGTEGGETRYSTTTQFDNVSDYHGFSMSGIKPISDSVTPITGLESYTASISVSEAGLASGGDAIAAADALLISITVTGPTGVSVTLEGYRTRYAPRTTP